MVDVSPAADVSALPPLSVVVIGRNEGERLIRCLESIRNADYPADVQLIYVDTNSTDDSCASATAWGAEVVAIDPPRPCAAAGRNAGLSQARHSFVHFFDGDTIVHPAWFREAMAAFEDPRVASVFGRREEIAPEASVYNFWAHHDWYGPPGPSGYCGGDAIFRREVLEELGGYDDGLIAGEERDLSFRLLQSGDRIIMRLDAPMTRHDMGMTRFGQYWKRGTRSGFAYAQVGSRYPGLRAWRRVYRRNFLHVGVLLAAIGASVYWFSPWPIGVWAALLILAVLRNALTCRPRVGSFGGALSYAVHIYLSKIPTLVGHLEFFLRRGLGRQPKRLIEYREEAKRA